MTDASPTDLSAGGARRVVEHAALGPLPPAGTAQLTVDGRPVLARAGEPIAAALLAAGIRVFRTMPGVGEARGPYCMVGRCSDCLMVVDGVLNVRTCVTPARDGMRISTQAGLDATPANIAAGSPSGGDE